MSANPGGRVGVPREVRELAAERTADAIRVLAEIMDDQAASHAARVAAAEALLNRAHGRPAQAIKVDLDRHERPVEELSIAELQEVVRGHRDALAPPKAS